MHSDTGISMKLYEIETDLYRKKKQLTDRTSLFVAKESVEPMNCPVHKEPLWKHISTRAHVQY